MTNEEIILNTFNTNRWLGKNPLKFNNINENDIYYLKSAENTTERVYRIFQVAKYNGTRDSKNRYQCRGGANRSTGDIWRIYKYYFGDIDIFTIMRALYKLVDDCKLGTFRCNTVRKRVFWITTNSNSWFTTRDYNTLGELGVPLRDWKEIGLNYGQTE